MFREVHPSSPESLRDRLTRLEAAERERRIFTSAGKQVAPYVVQLGGMRGMQAQNPQLLIKQPPFDIPEFELNMAWSSLLHHNVAHRWLRRLIQEEAERILEEE